MSWRQCGTGSWAIKGVETAKPGALLRIPLFTAANCAIAPKQDLGFMTATGTSTRYQVLVALSFHALLLHAILLRALRVFLLRLFQRV
jgi:hypothetical protein